MITIVASIRIRGAAKGEKLLKGTHLDEPVFSSSVVPFCGAVSV